MAARYPQNGLKSWKLGQNLSFPHPLCESHAHILMRQTCDRPRFVIVRLGVSSVFDLFHQVGDEEEKADPAVRRPGPEVLTVRGGPLSRLSVFTFNAPMALSAPLADLYDAKMAEVRARESEEDSGGGLIGKLRGKIRKLRGRGGQEEEEEEEEEDEGEDHQHVRFEHKADQVRKLPPTTSMRHVGARKWEGSRVVEDNKGVYMGAAIVTAGVVVGAGVATFAAGKKIVRAH